MIIAGDQLDYEFKIDFSQTLVSVTCMTKILLIEGGQWVSPNLQTCINENCILEFHSSRKSQKSLKPQLHRSTLVLSTAARGYNDQSSRH